MGRSHRIAAAWGIAAALAAARAGVSAAAPAGPAGPSRSAFSIQSWRTDDGLPNDMVNDVAQDGEGYLWAATNAGLARFDGVRFQVFDQQSTRELGSDACARLHSTRSGALWIGTVGGGLTRLAGGRFTGYGKKDGLEFQYPTAIFEDSEEEGVRVGAGGGPDAGGVLYIRIQALDKNAPKSDPARKVYSSTTQVSAGF